MDRPRILIADDTLVAETFKDLIEPEYQVIKVVTDGKTLLSAAVEMKPDVVLMDMDMSLLSGFDTGRELRKLLPKTKLILLAMNDDPDVASNALRQWPSGNLLNKAPCRQKSAARLTVSKCFIASETIQKLPQALCCVREAR